MKHNRFFEFDQAMTRIIRAEMKAEGIESYSAQCQSCKGTGTLHGKPCFNCNGQGRYELAIE